jgi:hypothetical protein
MKKENKEIETLEALKALHPDEKQCIQEIIDRLTMPDNLNKAAKKLFLAGYTGYDHKKWDEVAAKEVWRKVATYVWPHLTAGLRPGEFTGLKLTKGLDGRWIHFSSNGKHASLHLENTFGVGITGGAVKLWFDENYKEPKKQTCVKKLSEIIRMAESGEFGSVDGSYIVLPDTGMNITKFNIGWLKDYYNKEWDGKTEFPPEWLEER